MTTIEVADAAPPKLPFWRTLGQAYGLWALNLPELVRISWLWLVVMAPVVAALMWLQAPLFIEMIEASRTHRPVGSPGFLLAMQALSTLAMLPMLSSLAVAWHRLLLRDEHTASPVYFRFDGVVMAYAALALITGLMLSGPQYAVEIFESIFANAGQTSRGMAKFIGTVGSVVGLYVAGRMFMVLPARALGRDDVTFADAWKATRRNGWRLFFGYFFCVAPIGLAAGLLSWRLIALESSRFTFAMSWVAISLAEVLGGLVAVGFLSLAYRHVFEDHARGR